MIQEEKSLLLKDLCARLPYGIKCKDQYSDYINVNIYNVHIEHLIDQILSGVIKMILRPMSSMTEEEKKEFNSLINGVEERCINAYGKGGYTLAFTEVNDWLNAHHFDYRGLIEKDLALEAPEGMY